MYIQNVSSKCIKCVLETNDQMAEWSKALALGASLFGGAGSNPVLINLFF